MNHIPVMLPEILSLLTHHATASYIDATLGDGGHAAALLEISSPQGVLLGIDQDAKQLAIAADRLKPYGDRACLVVARFSDLAEVAKAEGFTQVDAILLDLGFSSRQLADSTYGLSFADTNPLDMRLSAELEHTAADLLNTANATTLADVLYDFGDRHNSRTLAQKLVDYRRKATFAVAADVKQALGVSSPAELAPVFQALRIWVNKEFDELKAVLPQTIDLLKPGGKLLVITFHSGEDRIVKQFLQSRHDVFDVPKHVIKPNYKDIKKNVRARSAKLRVATKK